MAQEHLYSSARIVIRGLIALKITNLAGVLPPGFAEDFHALEPLLCFSTVQALLLCIAEMVIFTGNLRSTDVLMSLFFIHQVACQHLLSLPVDVHGRALPKRPKDVSRDIQKLAVRLIEEHAVRHCEILSIDLIGNALTVLAELNALYNDKR